MNLENKKLVLFDFDGVLVDTLLVCYSINAEIHENLSLEEYKTFFLGNIYSAIRKDGTPKISLPEFPELYELRTREIIIPEILKSILKELSDSYILIVISSTHTKQIKKILERENVLECFTDILGSDVERNKVIKINSALEKYNISSKDVVFITDTVGDVKEARECGVEAIAVTWGFHDKETLEKVNPIAIVDDPKNLLKIINKVLE